MTKAIQVTCSSSTCQEEQQRFVDDIKLVQNAHSNTYVYCFECMYCDAIIIKPASDNILNGLLDFGVAILSSVSRSNSSQPDWVRQVVLMTGSSSEPNSGTPLPDNYLEAFAETLNDENAFQRALSWINNS